MKKILNTTLLIIGIFLFSKTSHCQANQPYFTENFDDAAAGQLTGTTASAPTTPTTYTLTSGNWTFYYAFRAGSGCNNDPVPISAKAIRILQTTATTPAGIVPPAYMIAPTVNFGIGSVTWNNAKNTAASNTGVWKSQNGGASWTLVLEVPTTSAICDNYTLNVNDPLANKIKFTNDNISSQIDIDHITINSYVTILPVTFESVRAFQKSNNIQIEWTSAQEFNVEKYAIEKSLDGSSFATIGFVNATGTTSSKTNYSFSDVAPLKRNNFYRIKSIDKDGKLSYTSVLRVAITNGTSSVTVSPNPVKAGQLSILMINAEKGLYHVSIYNAAGQNVFTSKINSEGGSLSQTINLPSSVKAGIYNMLISNGNSKMNKSIIVE